LCPAPGTSDYFCADVFAEATLTPEGVSLRASSRESRHDAVRLGSSYLAHAEATVMICGWHGTVATPASVVKFHIGLTGTASNSGSNPGILAQAFGTVRFNGVLIQCTGDVCDPVVVPSFDPAGCTTLDLRADTAFANQQNLTGWDADAVADFADTLKLVAIEALDEHGQPVPGLQYSITDDQGTPIFTFPNTPPASTTTTTTLPGSDTTTTLRIDLPTSP
jgi:hypothetical protein